MAASNSRWWWSFLSLAASVVGGTGHHAQLAALATGGTDHHVQLTSGGIARKARVHVPPQLTSKLPLVLNFHALSSTPELQELLTGFNVLADREGFLVAYPQGGVDARVWTPLPSPVGVNIHAHRDARSHARVP